jgi:hypothetical protein
MVGWIDNAIPELLHEKKYVQNRLSQLAGSTAVIKVIDKTELLTGA